LVDNGAIQSFFDQGFVVGKILPTKILKALNVSNANGHYTLYDHLVRLSMRMGNYELEDEFYIFPQDSV